MKLSILLYPMAVMLLIASCKKEAVIVPDTISPAYQLPQGNHPYDTKIVDFYHTYGCYILYKFEEKDFRWNVSYNLPYVADQGDENYIEPSLAALDKYLFKFYTTGFLKQAMPYKIILSSKIREIVYPNDTLDVSTNSVSTISHIAFGHAGSSLSTLSPSALKVLKQDLQNTFWTQAISYGKIPLPPFFIAATNYNAVLYWNRKNYGVFMDIGDESSNAYSDFKGYINVIMSSTAEELQKTLFLPANDPNGKYKLKYNMIIDYYKSAFGIDLQAIALDK